MPMIFADTIFRDANVITIDPDLPRAQAVALRDSKFLAVGSNDDVLDLIGPNTNVVDATGKTILPGFIDAHIHVLSSGIRHVMAADCDRRTVNQVQDAIRERMSITPHGEWIQGFKYDDTKTARNLLSRRATAPHANLSSGSADV